MDYALVSAVALLVSALTFFSGFGLGTLLLPAFALLFPVPVAVAATAIVHLANNLFKAALIGRDADRLVVARFAVPAAAAAMVGAALLGLLARVTPLATYELGGQVHAVTSVKATVAVLMVGFALFELVPALARLSFAPHHLCLGGVLSGFFGGLSGHQGALRAAFLVKAGLAPRAFVGTNVVSAVIVDLARLAVYGAEFSGAGLGGSGRGGTLIAAATAAAFLGSFLGNRLLGKVTLRTIQLLVGALLVVVALALGTGLV